MELLRYVTLDVGGRPSVVLDLNDMTLLTMARDSFQVTPGSKQPITSASGRRYGGERQVGETTANGKVSWRVLVAGATADECISLVEKLLAQVEGNPLGLWLEWRPDGASQSALYEVRGTAEWGCLYKWVEFAGAQVMPFDIQIPVAPLAYGLPMDITDSFTVDTRSDYTYDSGASSDEAVKGGVLEAVANVATEKRAIHTARGYLYGDNQQTVKATPGATITGWKSGCVVKRVSTTTYLEAYIDDNGTNSRLRIDKIVAGVRTNLTTTNLIARVKAGVSFWVRGRIEGNLVVAEYFESAPKPMGAHDNEQSYTLKAGVEIETFGAGVRGAPGRVWVPQTVGATLDDYTVEQYVYRNKTLPSTLALSGNIPGDAPAKADVTITHSGGAAAPISALLGWVSKPPAGLASAPFGILEAETAGNLSGWSVAAKGTARGGSMLEDAAALSTDVYTASWAVDPSLMVPDAFSGEVAIEVWARVMLAATIITPSLTLSTRPEDGLSYGSARYTDEWGSVGKLLVRPASGTGIWRMTRLGTLRMLVDPLRPRKWLVWLGGAVGADTSGAWGVDYLCLVAGAQRACSPSSKANDSTYPTFIGSTAETSKTVKSDLSALVSLPPKYGHPDHGLGGQLLELPPGEVEMLAKLSSLVADDPTSNATTEQLSHAATVHVAVTPRWYLMRSGS
ncbi:MAG: hypothetical protein ACRDK4_05030 [Solirubrobacteraceae bacterium]